MYTDLHKQIADEFVNKLYRFMIDKKLTIKNISERIEEPIAKINRWFNNTEIPDGNDLGKIEDFMENDGNPIQQQEQILIDTIEEIKAKKQYNIREVAKIFDVSEATIHYWLQNIKKPTTKHLLQIVDVLLRKIKYDENIFNILQVNYTLKSNHKCATYKQYSKNFRKKHKVNKSTVWRWKTRKTKPNLKHRKKLYEYFNAEDYMKYNTASKKQISISLDTDTINEIDKIAKEEGKSRSFVLADIVRAYFDTITDTGENINITNIEK